MTAASLLTPDDVVVLSSESLHCDGDDDAVQFNVAFVNALLRELLRLSEISRDAVTGYYVDYYLAQVRNGGFSQFVYNTSWKPEVVSIVKDGLRKIGAIQHLSLFEKGEWLVEHEPSKLSKFLSGEYFGVNKERDRFDSITKQFLSLDKAENLRELNALWLKSRPNVCVVPLAEARRQIDMRAAAIPDLAARRAESLASAPRHIRLIYALCSAADQSLDRVTAGSLSHDHEGEKIFAWHFITDKGHHYMVELYGKAMMFVGTGERKVVEIVAE